MSRSGSEYFHTPPGPFGSCYPAGLGANEIDYPTLTFSVPCQRRQLKHQQTTYVCAL